MQRRHAHLALAGLEARRAAVAVMTVDDTVGLENAAAAGFVVAAAVPAGAVTLCYRRVVPGNFYL